MVYAGIANLSIAKSVSLEKRRESLAIRDRRGRQSCFQIFDSRKINVICLLCLLTAFCAFSTISLYSHVLFRLNRQSPRQPSEDTFPEETVQITFVDPDSKEPCLLSKKAYPSFAAEPKHNASVMFYDHEVGCEHLWEQNWQNRTMWFQWKHVVYKDLSLQEFGECLQAHIGIYRNCRHVLYSAVFGGYDLVHVPNAGNDNNTRGAGFCFILFTDTRTLQSSAKAGISVEQVGQVWDVVVVDNLPLPSSVPKSLRVLKMLPQLFFPNAQSSLWIDGKISPRVTFKHLFGQIAATKSHLALLEHLKFPWNPLFEFEFVLRESRFDCVQISNQMQQYFVKEKGWKCGLPKSPSNGGWPPYQGMEGFDAAVIYRNHRNTTVLTICTLWFLEVMRFSFRDQLSLQYVFDKLSIPIHDFIQKITQEEQKELFRVIVHTNRSANADHNTSACQSGRSLFLKRFRMHLLTLCFKYKASSLQRTPVVCRDYHHLLLENGTISVNYLNLFPHMVHNLQGAQSLPILSPLHMSSCRAQLLNWTASRTMKIWRSKHHILERILMNLWIDVLATGTAGGWMDEVGLEDSVVRLIYELIQDFRSQEACYPSHLTSTWVSFERWRWMSSNSTTAPGKRTLTCSKACFLSKELSYGDTLTFVNSAVVLEDLRKLYRPLIPDLVSLLHVNCTKRLVGDEILRSYPLVVSGGFVIVNCVAPVKACKAVIAAHLREHYNHDPKMSLDQRYSILWFQKPYTTGNFLQASRVYSMLQWEWYATGLVLPFFNWNKSSFGVLESLALKNFITSNLISTICVSGFETVEVVIALLVYTDAYVFIDTDMIQMDWESTRAWKVTEALFQRRFSVVEIWDFVHLNDISCTAFVLPLQSSAGSSKIDRTMNGTRQNSLFFFFFGREMLLSWNEEYNYLKDKGLVLHSQGRGREGGWNVATTGLSHPPYELIHLATTHCGSGENGFDELKVLFKSVLHFLAPEKKLIFHIVSNTSTVLRSNIAEWALPTNLKANILPAEYMENNIQYFKPCSMERLTLARLLPKVSCILYIDRDSIVLQDVSRAYQSICKQLKEARQLVGMTPCGTPWYPIFKHGLARVWKTYPGDSGMQAGVLFMNLELMRSTHFEKTLTELVGVVPFLQLGDQDLLNFFFARNEKLLLPLDCQYNTRLYANMLECNCFVEKVSQKMLCYNNATLLDAVIVHGNRGAFHKVDGVLKELWNEFHWSSIIFQGSNVV